MATNRKGLRLMERSRGDSNISIKKYTETTVKKIFYLGYCKSRKNFTKRYDWQSRNKEAEFIANHT